MHCRHVATHGNWMPMGSRLKCRGLGGGLAPRCGALVRNCVEITGQSQTEPPAMGK
ncbi:hypothetical protein DPMN_097507 [Dreissena polymorpha]|uniref:Uncharacterized protein n=1 Tax=Dreissena polymorpha TaxID=45954 RepID=A0A9D4LAD5_DREPO|nr:hypothetical protein DPMN_097507 [Dreissena polymorpha]